MGQERNQKAARAMLRRISKGNDEPEAIAEQVIGGIPEECSREVLTEEIARWFFALRASSRHGTFPPHFPLSRLIAAFGKVAQKRNIGAEQFYSSLLEKFILEIGAEEGARVLPKFSSRGKILEAALEVFSEKGFHLATVDEIAERAGVGKGTLYRYFTNKENLFNELIRLRLEELEKSAEAVLDGHDDVLTMISKYLRTYFEFFDRNQRLYRLIVQERPDVGEQVQDLYVKKIMRRIPLLKRKIYEASQRGVLKDIDFQTVFFGVMGFIHGVIQKWLASDCSYTLVDELPTVMELLFYGFVGRSHVVDDQGKNH